MQQIRKAQAATFSGVFKPEKKNNEPRMLCLASRPSPQFSGVFLLIKTFRVSPDKSEQVVTNPGYRQAGISPVRIRSVLPIKVFESPSKYSFSRVKYLLIKFRA